MRSWIWGVRLISSFITSGSGRLLVRNNSFFWQRKSLTECVGNELHVTQNSNFKWKQSGQCSDWVAWRMIASWTERRRANLKQLTTDRASHRSVLGLTWQLKAASAMFDLSKTKHKYQCLHFLLQELVSVVSVQPNVTWQTFWCITVYKNYFSGLYWKTHFKHFTLWTMGEGATMWRSRYQKYNRWNQVWLCWQ